MRGTTNKNDRACSDDNPISIDTASLKVPTYIGHWYSEIGDIKIYTTKKPN